MPKKGVFIATEYYPHDGEERLCVATSPKKAWRLAITTIISRRFRPRINEFKVSEDGGQLKDMSTSISVERAFVDRCWNESKNPIPVPEKWKEMLEAAMSAEFPEIPIATYQNETGTWSIAMPTNPTILNALKPIGFVEFDRFVIIEKGDINTKMNEFGTNILGLIEILIQDRAVYEAVKAIY